MHLLAKKSTTSIIENAAPADQTELLTSQLSKLFAAHKIETDTTKLSARLEGLSLSAENPTPISNAVMAYLTQDANVPSKDAEAIVQQGLLALGGASETALEVSGPEPVLITNVHDWKAGLMVDAGAHAVAPLSDFEDIEPKL